jgi:IMP cyclohydrolase
MDQGKHFFDIIIMLCYLLDSNWTEMHPSLVELSKREYPGRIIIAGKDESGENIVTVYAITGRSPSSQARQIIREKNLIWVKPTDPEILKKGNPDLLIYPALFLSNFIAVSNGRQTSDIMKHIGEAQGAKAVLSSALKKWDFEPDPPTFTPRISGCITSHMGSALSIIKRAQDGTSARYTYDIKLNHPGYGKMLATYSGENRDPLPSYSGGPADIPIFGKNAAEYAEAVYESLKPRDRKSDFRVALVCVFCHNLLSQDYDIFIINQHERIEKDNGKNR